MSEVDILKVILEANPGLSIDDALKLTDKAIKSLSKTKADIAKGNTGASDDGNGPVDKKMSGHGYTKADLKVNPMSALKGEKATCCLCGKPFDVITKTHLWVSHGITPVQYRELCGYASDTKLMTDAQLKKKQEILEKAKPWEHTTHCKNNQTKGVANQAAKEAAAQLMDEIDTDDKSTPKETPKDAKSDTKPQANASGKPEKKDDKGDNAPKS